MRPTLLLTFGLSLQYSSVGYAQTLPAPPPVAPFSISSAHHYELAGPIRFQTEYSNMQGFNSPTIGGTNPDGLFVFFPPKGDAPGGSLQATLLDVATDLQFVCDTGATGQMFEVLIVEKENAGRQRSTKMTPSSGQTPKGATFSFNTGHEFGIGEISVRITSETATRVWNLGKCFVTPKG